MPTILVVDDNRDNRTILSRLLQFGGYAVISADGGHAALEQARSSQPDLILMDLEMPDIDGWTATRKLKEEPLVSHIPVVAVSGYATSDEIERAQVAGCIDVLTKPVEYEILMRKVAQYVPLTEATVS